MKVAVACLSCWLRDVMLLLEGAACLLESALLWACPSIGVSPGLAHRHVRIAEHLLKSTALNLQGEKSLTQVMAAEVQQTSLGSKEIGERQPVPEI